MSPPAITTAIDRAQDKTHTVASRLPDLRVAVTRRCAAVIRNRAQGQ